jgi:hypothetical protein
MVMARQVPQPPDQTPTPGEPDEPEEHMHFWIETGRHIVIGTIAMDLYDCRDCGETLRRGDRAC